MKKLTPKNPYIATGLGLALGPIGIVYVSSGQAVLAFIAFAGAIVITLATFGVAIPGIAIGYGLWAFFAARKHNDVVAREQLAARHLASFAGASPHPRPGTFTPAQWPTAALHGAVTTPQQALTLGRFCSHCGGALRSRAEFCGSCGQRPRGTSQ